VLGTQRVEHNDAYLFDLHESRDFLGAWRLKMGRQSRVFQVFSDILRLEPTNDTIGIRVQKLHALLIERLENFVVKRLHVPLAHIEDARSNCQRLVIVDFTLHDFEKHHVFFGIDDMVVFDRL
jgi:hypothetical protein